MCSQNTQIWVSADSGGGQWVGGQPGEWGWSSGLGWLGSAGPARVPLKRAQQQVRVGSTWPGRVGLRRAGGQAPCLSGLETSGPGSSIPICE